MLIDRGAHEALGGLADDREGDREGDRDDAGSPYVFRRVRRVSVKGYSRLAAWALRPRG